MANDYYEKVLEVEKELHGQKPHTDNQLFNLYYSLGEAYYGIANPREKPTVWIEAATSQAIYSFERAISVFEQNRGEHDPVKACECYLNLTALQREHDSCSSNVMKCLDLADQIAETTIDLWKLRFAVWVYMSTVELLGEADQINALIRAEVIATKLRSLSNKQDGTKQLLRIYTDLSEAYSRHKDTDRATEYRLKFQQLKYQ